LSNIQAARRPVAITVISILLLAVLIGLGTACMSILAQEAGPQVTTSEEDYAPEETVQISGTGFTPNAELTVRVTRPDDSVVTGDGSFAPWPTSYDGVIAGAEGEFEYYYVLNGILGEYLVEVLDGPWDDPLIGEAPVLASTTFTDGRKINWVTLDGGTSVTVGPGDAITAEVNVKTGGWDNDWKSTGWRISTTPPGSVSYTHLTLPTSDLV